MLGDRGGLGLGLGRPHRACSVIGEAFRVKHFRKAAARGSSWVRIRVGFADRRMDTAACEVGGIMPCALGSDRIMPCALGFRTPASEVYTCMYEACE